MTKQDKEQLKLEIDNIFESGANETRIFETVVNFIESRKEGFVLADVIGQLLSFFLWFRANGELHIGKSVEKMIEIYLKESKNIE